MDRVVDVDADAAVDVQRGVPDAVAAVGRPELRGRDLERVVAPFVEVRRGLQHRELDRLVVDEAVGHALTDRLERADRAVELLALGRVLRGEPQRLVGDARHDARRSRRSCGCSVNARISAALLERSRAARRRRRARRRAAPRTAARGSSISWRSSVTPGRVGRHEEHADAVVDARRDEHELRRGGAGDVRLHAVDAPAVAVARRGRGRLFRLGAELDERGREQHVAARRPSTRTACCASVPNRAIGSAALTSVGINGSGATWRPTSRSTMHRSRKPKPSPPADSGSAMPSRFALANSRQVSQVVPVVGAVALLQVLQRHAVLEDARRERRASSCCSSERAKSMRRRLLASHRGLPGMFSPKIAIRSRCISLVPPPKVRMCIDAQHALDPAREHRAGRVALRAVAWSRMISISSRAASM